LNLRRLSRQIYSLIPLTAREPLQKCKPAIVLQTLLRVNTYTPVAVSRAPRSNATPVRLKNHRIQHAGHLTIKHRQGQVLLTGQVSYNWITVCPGTFYRKSVKYRRLYFPVPGRTQAPSATVNLSRQNTCPEDIHAHTDKCSRTRRLLQTTIRQNIDA
jgi:hypothetical protein